LSFANFDIASGRNDARAERSASPAVGDRGGSCATGCEGGRDASAEFGRDAGVEIGAQPLRHHRDVL